MYVRTPFTVPSHPKVCAFVRYNRPPQSSHEQKTGVDLCTFKTLSIVSLIDATSLSTNILKNEIGSGDSQTGVSVPCDVLFHLSNAKRFKTAPPPCCCPTSSFCCVRQHVVSRPNECLLVCPDMLCTKILDVNKRFRGVVSSVDQLGVLIYWGAWTCDMRRITIPVLRSIQLDWRFLS